MLPEPILETRVFAPATVANVACGYDVLGFAIDAPGDEVVVRRPDILILEGLNVLQVGGSDAARPEFVSDYFDFSIYIDADEDDIEAFYVQRFLTLCDTVFQNPDSFFQHYAHLSREEAIEPARFIWREINGRNLRENIAPTKGRAGLLLRKGPDHRVTDVSLRRL